MIIITSENYSLEIIRFLDINVFHKNILLPSMKLKMYVIVYNFFY